MVRLAVLHWDDTSRRLLLSISIVNAKYSRSGDFVSWELSNFLPQPPDDIRALERSNPCASVDAVCSRVVPPNGLNLEVRQRCMFRGIQPWLASHHSARA